MASCSGNGSRGRHQFTLNVWESYVSDGANNYSTVNWSLVLSPIQRGWDWNYSSTIPVKYSVWVAGQNYTGNIMKYDGSSTVTVASGSLNVTHNADGSKSIDFSFSVWDNVSASYLPGSANGSGSMALTKIARYLDSISISERGHGWNYIQVNWSCSPKRDWTQYSLNGGAWTDAGDTVASDGKSGWFNIGNLKENTKYTIKVRLRRADSGLWSESNTITITTASGHTSITQFTVSKVSGTATQLKFNWATSNTIDYLWYSTNNGSSWTGLDVTDGTSGNFIISGLSSGTSYNCKIRVRRKDSQMTTDSGTVTQSTYTQTKFTKNNVNHVSGYSGLSQLKVEWATNITIQKLELSLNDGSTWTDKGNPNSTSGSFTITSLSMNTYYNIKLRATSKDGSVVVTTGTIKQNTYNKVTGNLYKNGTKLDSTTGIVITTTDKLEFKDINNSAGCTYKIYFETPDNTRRITQSGTTITAAQIQSMFQYLPNSNSQAFNVGIATMNGNTEAQYVDWYGNLVVTNSNPVFNNFTYEDTDATCKVLTGGNQGIIKGYSDVKVNISTANKAVGKDYATISKYRVVIGEKQKEISYSSSSNVSGQIDNVVNNVFTVYAIDSRGNSTSKQISPSAYYDYSNIKITKAEVVRTNLVGKETELYFEGQYWNRSFGAVTNGIVECYYEYKNTSSEQWVRGTSPFTLTFDGSKFSFRGLIKGDAGAEGFSVTNNFNIRVTVKDRLSKSTFDLILGSGTPQLAIAQDGVAVGAMYDPSLGGDLQVNDRVLDKALTYINTCDDADTCIRPRNISCWRKCK